MFFEPLFEFEGQPQCVLRYITMFMSKDNMFYLIQSNDRGARPPMAKGLVGLCFNCLNDTPTESIGVPEELRDIPMASKEKLCKSVSIESLFETCDVLRGTGLLSEEDYKKLINSHRGIRNDIYRKMTESQDAFDAVCKVLIKRRDKKTLSSYIQDWEGFVLSSPYLSQFDALLGLDSAILDRNISVAAFLSTCQMGRNELDERRRKVTTAVIASSSVGIASGGMIIAGIILAPVSFGASLGLSIAGGALGVGTGLTAGTARVVEGVKQNTKLKDIRTEQAIIKAKEEKVIAALQTVEKLFEKPCAKALGSAEHGPGMSLRWLSAVASAFRSAHSVTAIALAAVRLGTTAAAISAAVLGPLSLVLDVAFLAEAAHNKRKGDKTNAGDMLHIMAETVDIKCKIFNNMLRGDTVNDERLLDWS